MPIDTRFVGALALLVALAPAAPAQEGWGVGTTPAWVRPTEVDLARTEAEEYALIEHQASYLGPEPELFSRWVVRFGDERAIQEGSQLEIEFDPTYQRLELHAVKLLRNGTAIDQLDTSRIRVIQRQTDLDYQLYDGTHSLLLFLEDVRKGDALDYSYTLTGANPAFEKHHMGWLGASWGVPVDDICYRVLWPRGRTLHVQAHGESPLNATVTELDDHVEYAWRGTEKGYTFDEGGYPGWHDPLPWIQLSDFADWGEVADLGLRLFATEPPDAMLEAQIEELRAAGTNDAERMLLALRFAQDEIRYLGIEIGEGSHRPASPRVVLQRRFGDCKDKSLLLVSLLRGLGIEAHPVLVNSYERAHVDRWYPSALAFDHAIVTARLGRKSYWFDPTILVQRGSLESFETAPYGRGLVIEEGANGLTEIPQPALEHPLTTIHQRLLLSLDEAVELTVVTTHVDTNADDQRAELQGQDPDMLGRDFTAYYANLYPSIEQLAAPVIVDDPDSNELTITERYRIPDFWDEGVASLLPQELTHYFDIPASSTRTSPLAAPHPVHTRYVIDARLDEGWDIESESALVETPAGTFSFSADARGRRLRLEYAYRSSADHVVPEDLREYTERCDEIQDLLEFPIQAPAEHALSAFASANWPVLLTGLFTAALGTLVLILIAVVNPRAPLPRPVDSGPTGLGGWLVPVMLVVVFSPVYLLSSFVMRADDWGASAWERLGDPSSAEYLAYWTPYAMARTFVGTLTLLCAFACVPLFFLKRRSFVLVFLARCALHVAGIALAASYAMARGTDGTQDAAILLAAVLATLVGLGYLVVARRVRNTFVR